MLEQIARQFTPDTTLVSYNGITFDFNLLKERFILHRIQRDIPHQHHIDLLHTTRRLFRRRLRDCTLSNIERELFAFYRTDDIPGYLVPSVSFAWLAEDEVEQISRVISHNRQDIVTLAFLLLRIVAVFETAGEELSHPDDLYSLSRIYGRRKQIGRVVALLDSIEQASRSPQMLFDQAMALKRCGDREAAAAIWEQLAAIGGPVGFGAGIELAKYYEHMVADNRRALRVLEQVAPFCPDRIRPKTELRRRWNRLQGRLLKK